jgi:hypothetical protein
VQHGVVVILCCIELIVNVTCIWSGRFLAELTK